MTRFRACALLEHIQQVEYAHRQSRAISDGNGFPIVRPEISRTAVRFHGNDEIGADSRLRGNECPIENAALHQVPGPVA